MSIKVCENVPSVTIFGNFCVIWALLRKVELFLTEVENAAEFIVTSLRTQPHTERRGAASRLWIRYVETLESKQRSSGRWAALGVQSGEAKRGTNSSVSRRFCERLTILTLFFSCRGCCLIFKNIVNLIQNVLKSINSWVLEKIRWVHPQCTKHAMVLSKVIIFFEKWMNPHTNIIHKVMPFKRTFFCWQQTALLLRNRHDGNWWCRFETNVHSDRNAPYRFQTLCWLSATPRVAVRVVVP